MSSPSSLLTSGKASLPGEVSLTPITANDDVAPPPNATLVPSALANDIELIDPDAIFGAYTRRF